MVLYLITHELSVIILVIQSGSKHIYRKIHVLLKRLYYAKANDGFGYRQTKHYLFLIGCCMNKKNRFDESLLIDEINAAKYIGMSRSFLRQDRMNGYRKNRTKGPAFIRVGRNIRYHLHDLIAWVDENRIIRQCF